ncbi:MAG: GDP-mannose 4,6-dehydratase [Chloroflexi bacterium]|nr:GDP-mannose 4,6-dehydratase [Chloroflexota bacterium]
MNWQGKRVLVTGAGGFIGSHLTERLLALGARTRALVHYRADGTWGWLDDCKYKDEIDVLAGDIRDRDSVAKAMRGTEIVFHLAALIGIPYSYHVPLSYVCTNVEGTLNVLQTARDLAVERIVHTSTSEVYGSARYVPMGEMHPLQAQSPYAATKISADKLAESFFLSFGLPVVTVRPFNTYGPRQSARAIIPTIITQCLSGSSVCLGNVHPTRDLTYVTDVVEGFVLAAGSAEAIGCTINIGSGNEISIKDLACLIGNLLDRTIVIQEEGERVRPEKSEVERLRADIRIALQILGWKPSISLEDGLRLTIGWLRGRLSGYRPRTYAL